MESFWEGIHIVLVLWLSRSCPWTKQNKRHLCLQQEWTKWLWNWKIPRYSLSFPCSLCRAPGVFGGALSQDRALHFLCQPAAGVHLPAPRGREQDQHWAHSGGHTAAPPLQGLCHSTLGCSSHRPAGDSYLHLREFPLKCMNLLLAIDISLSQSSSESGCKPRSRLTVCFLVWSLWKSQIFLQGSGPYSPLWEQLKPDVVPVPSWSHAVSPCPRQAKSSSCSVLSKPQENSTEYLSKSWVGAISVNGLMTWSNLTSESTILKLCFGFIVLNLATLICQQVGEKSNQPNQHPNSRKHIRMRVPSRVNLMLSISHILGKKSF